ncbi:hypothetical protein F2P81_022075 [Scophthalmus maximus]|uniref:Uncharacterized protein n=1 Tax=Scophthalmus maximus TaxID=52904 RepID=A0A6A4S3U8_SCOMX|nr:hypothetical protein F2P81_022075 [Scophthalmus maximus]
MSHNSAIIPQSLTKRCCLCPRLCVRCETATGRRFVTDAQRSATRHDVLLETRAGGPAPSCQTTVDDGDRVVQTKLHIIKEEEERPSDEFSWTRDPWPGQRQLVEQGRELTR